MRKPALRVGNLDGHVFLRLTRTWIGLRVDEMVKLTPKQARSLATDLRKHAAEAAFEISAQQESQRLTWKRDGE